MIPYGKASDAVIIGIIQIFRHSTFGIFDLRSTFFLMYTYVAIGFDDSYDTLDMPPHVSTPVGDSLAVNRVYHFFIVTFMRSKTYLDLIFLDMVGFDAILGMYFIGSYHDIWFVLPSQ